IREVDPAVDSPIFDIWPRAEYARHFLSKLRERQQTHFYLKSTETEDPGPLSICSALTHQDQDGISNSPSESVERANSLDISLSLNTSRRKSPSTAPETQTLVLDLTAVQDEDHAFFDAT